MLDSSSPECDTVLQRVKTLLSQAYNFSFNAGGGGSIALDVLLVVRHNVEEILQIIRDNDHLFRQPRIHLKRMRDVKTEVNHDDSGNNGPSNDVDGEESSTSDGLQDLEEELGLLHRNEPGDTEHKVENDLGFLDDQIQALASVIKIEPDQISSLADVPSFILRNQEGEVPLPLKSDPLQLESNPRTSNKAQNYCKICEKRLFALDRLTLNEEETMQNDHMKLHHPELTFHCDCGSYMCDEEDLRNHLIDHPAGNVEKLIGTSACEFCELRFLDDGQLTKTIQYFWKKLGDVNFIKQHLIACQRRNFLPLSKMDMCKHCEKPYPRRHALKHLVEHHKKMAVQCDICGEWSAPEHLRSHRSHVHFQPKKKQEAKLEEQERRTKMKIDYHCEHCNKTVSVVHVEDVDKARRSHMAAFHSKNIVSCDCGVDMWTKSEELQHAEEHPTMTCQPLVTMVPTSCSTCGLVFVDEEGDMTSEWRHFRFARDDKDFVQNHLVQCLKTITHRAAYKCVMCGTEIRKYLNLRHCVENHRDKMRQCNICNFWFSKTKLASHQYSVHGVARWRKKVTGKKIPRKKTEEKSHICPHCGISFEMKHHFSSHERRCKSNPSEDHVACQFCGQNIKKALLSSHEMEHVREGVLHTCEYCGKEMPYKTYVRHVSKHRKGKAPKKECPICHKSVAALGLKAHVQRHEQLKPYPCGVCGKTFSERRNVQRHADQVHNGISLLENVSSLTP